MIGIKNEFSIVIKNGNTETSDLLLKHIKSKFEIDLVKETDKTEKSVCQNYKYKLKGENKPGRKRTLTSKDEAKIKIQQFEKGYSLTELASIYNVSRATIIRILKR